MSDQRGVTPPATAALPEVVGARAVVLTPEEAAAALFVIGEALRGSVVMVMDIPAGVGRAMVKLAQIAGPVKPRPNLLNVDLGGFDDEG